jgi:hypothetical protein
MRQTKMEIVMDTRMESQRSMIAVSCAIALLWVAGALWWNAPMSTVRAVLIILLGALAGLLWYAAMKLWMRYFVQPLW